MKRIFVIFAAFIANAVAFAQDIRVEYMDGNGIPCTYDLPDLAPGELHTFVLRGINRTYAFRVVRPGGQSVIEY